MYRFLGSSIVIYYNIFTTPGSWYPFGLDTMDIIKIYDKITHHHHYLRLNVIGQCHNFSSSWSILVLGYFLCTNLSFWCVRSLLLLVHVFEDFVLMGNVISLFSQEIGNSMEFSWFSFCLSFFFTIMMFEWWS